MPSRGGRPRADDAEALGRMAVLLVSGQVTAQREAARRAGHLAEQGSNPDAIIERLRRSYRRHRPALEHWARDQLVTEFSPFLLKSMSGPAREEARRRRRQAVQALLVSDDLSDEEIRRVNRILDRSG